MEDISLTEAVFHDPIFRLKAVAEPNMAYMLPTDAVFHFETSSLNVGLDANSDAMMETPTTFQSPIGPPFSVVAVAGLVIHFSTTELMLSSVMQVTQSDPTVHA
jgi:hypothetical protein